MNLLQEKSILPSRLLSCLILFSILLLIYSSLSLLHFDLNSSISVSVFQLTLLNNTPSLTSMANATAFPNLTLHTHTTKQCDAAHALLRVYMYDLPPEFHFGLLGWKGSPNETWPSLRDVKRLPSYPGGLNLQHSPEYWLTLDLLASNTQNVVRPCSAYRVQNWRDAEVVFVPFFSSLSYNRHSKRRDREKASDDRVLQEKLVEFLLGREEWKVRGGRDHLVVAHHPNSMLVARKKLGTTMFVLADFGRYPPTLANIDKDVIAPYKHMVNTIPAAASASFNQRATLMYFQGAISRKDVSHC